jgi:hypothetical protein
MPPCQPANAGLATKKIAQQNDVAFDDILDK